LQNPFLGLCENQWLRNERRNDAVRVQNFAHFADQVFFAERFVQQVRAGGQDGPRGRAVHKRAGRIRARIQLGGTEGRSCRNRGRLSPGDLWRDQGDREVGQGRGGGVVGFGCRAVSRAGLALDRHGLGRCRAEKIVHVRFHIVTNRAVEKLTWTALERK